MAREPRSASASRFGFAGGLRRAPWRRGLDEFPELAFADDSHRVSLRGEAFHFHQLETAVPSGRLQLVRSSAHEHVSRLPGFRLEDRARFLRRGDCFAARTTQETRKGDAPTLETGQS